MCSHGYDLRVTASQVLVDHRSHAIGRLAASWARSELWTTLRLRSATRTLSPKYRKIRGVARQNAARRHRTQPPRHPDWCSRKAPFSQSTADSSLSRTSSNCRLRSRRLVEREGSVGSMISGVRLGKVCRTLSIPVPPRGYWAHVRSGAAVRKPSLPRLGLSTQPSANRHAKAQGNGNRESAARFFRQARHPQVLKIVRFP